eukprot:TRINITY_DN4443_c0_g1_i1.p1 TRINITY_DN4443_c0_g1~~TRINITY_DN4443_c0_g1_i1.p1  ORF type:complete len:318 (+),score=57.34 TRINITY_DN4443_c0_g1_i1:146-1099(+)
MCIRDRNHICQLILVGYTAYIGRLTLRKRYLLPTRPLHLIHSWSGIVLMGLGTFQWVSMSNSGEHPAWAFWFWTVCFLLNAGTGFVMVPVLPHTDPATKREFVTLFLVQLFYSPYTVGCVMAPGPMRPLCFFIILCGCITSVANTILYLFDWSEGKSNQICGATIGTTTHTVKSQKLSLREHYVSILFERGSTKTKMPANKRMILISFTLIFPFLVYLLPVWNMHMIYNDFPNMAKFQYFSGYLLGTIGSIQIFHGTLSVRGSDKVLRSTNFVIGTTFVEMVMLLLFIYKHIGVQESIKYVVTIFNLTSVVPAESWM